MTQVSNKGLSRPGSAYVFYGGNKNVIWKSKSWLGIKKAWDWDFKDPVTHTYKAQPMKIGGVSTKVHVPPIQVKEDVPELIQK